MNCNAPGARVLPPAAHACPMASRRKPLLSSCTRTRVIGKVLAERLMESALAFAPLPPSRLPGCSCAGCLVVSGVGAAFILARSTGSCVQTPPPRMHGGQETVRSKTSTSGRHAHKGAGTQQRAGWRIPAPPAAALTWRGNVCWIRYSNYIHMPSSAAATGPGTQLGWWVGTARHRSPLRSAAMAPSIQPPQLSNVSLIGVEHRDQSSALRSKLTPQQRQRDHTLL